MHSSPPRQLTLSDIFRTLWRYRVRFLATSLLVLVAAVVYAIYAPTTWESSQAFVMREMDASQEKNHNEADAKNAQQTLQEMLLSMSLLRNVLQKAGPPPTAVADTWPTEKEVSTFRESVFLAPPKGSEMGKSNVLYLKVRDRDRDRSLQLTETLYIDLDKAFGELQATIAKNKIAELKESVALAESNLKQATQRLSEIEKEAGIDLVSLRMLNQSPTGDTHVYHVLTSTLDELRQTKATQSQHAAMLEMLKAAEKSPLILIAAPRELQDYHPGLGRLIQGLAEARLRGFTEASKLTEEHADIKSLRREEVGIRDGIRQELASAIQGVSVSHQLASARRKALEEQVDDYNQRLARLTDLRAEYSTVANQVDARRNLVEESQRNLLHAHAEFTAATSSTLLSRMDLPEGGIRPVGPTRTMIALGGLIAGIFAGVGMVFLTAPVKRSAMPLLPETRFVQIRHRRHKTARRKIKSQHYQAIGSSVGSTNGLSNGDNH